MKFKLIILIALSVSTSAFASGINISKAIELSPKRAWDSINNPDMLFSQYENRLYHLPVSGRSSVKPWSDTYWPSMKGGTAFRWQSPVSDRSRPFTYYLASWRGVSEMTDAQINMLSPAEKYDILMGNFNYPTVMKEKQRTHVTDESWFGLCHAVAVTSTQFPEPQIKSFTIELPNKVLKTITFYSSDTKALLAGYVNEHFPDTNTMGRRCESKSDTISEGCWDVNPGSFFIAVTNVIGLMHDSLILDIDRNNEVWNSAAWGYDYTISPKNGIGKMAAPGTVKEYVVTMKILNNKGALPQKNPNGSVSMVSTYQFTIETDRNAVIIGGEWISENHPDFTWMARKVNIEDGYYSGLNDLLN